MKNLLSLSIILLAGTGFAFGDSILVSSASQTVSAGQSFTVDINIDQIPDVYDYQFSLTFDPNVLTAQSVTEGALFANTGNSFFRAGAIDNGAGSIRATIDTLIGTVPGVAGPGTLTAVQFEAIHAGISSIDFSPLDDLILEDSHLTTLTVTAQSGQATAAATSVPEPATVSSLAVALIFLALWRRFRLKVCPGMN